MKEIRKISCPCCGKTLICIDADDEDRVFCFWCDDCDIDVTVEVHD